MKETKEREQRDRKERDRTGKKQRGDRPPSTHLKRDTTKPSTKVTRKARAKLQGKCVPQQHNCQRTARKERSFKTKGENEFTQRDPQQEGREQLRSVGHVIPAKDVTKEHNEQSAFPPQQHKSQTQERRSEDVRMR